MNRSKRLDRSKQSLNEKQIYMELDFLKNSSELNHLFKGIKLVKYSKKTGKKPSERLVKFELFPPSVVYEAKSKSKSVIPLHSILEIRLGQNTKEFLPYRYLQLQNCSFSIIYMDRSRHKTINFSASSEKECLQCVYALNMLLATEPSTFVNAPLLELSVWLKGLWNSVDINLTGSLDIEDISRLLAKLKILLSIREIKSYLKTSNLERVTFSQFERLYRNLRYRPEIAEIFVSLCKENQSYLTFSEFCSFLSDTQNYEWSNEKYLAVFKKFTPQNSVGMDIDHFTAFLMSSKNSAINKKISDNLDLPLHHYYVNSSHNTYLLSDQLIGDSSVEGYIRALQRGCRCVELDCWDGPGNTPIIYHGRTLTSKILFRDAVEAIQKYAFVASNSPLILSLEIHCSPLQQDVMAEILMVTFGEALIKTAFDVSSESIPSPKSLEGRVLLKGKLISGGGEVDSDEEQSQRTSAVGFRTSRTNSPGLEQRKREFSQTLSDLIIYFKGVPWRTLESSQANPQDLRFNQIVSITDRKAYMLMNVIKDVAKSNVVRVYPSIIRVNSSNFDPLPFWFSGIQMVALNFQTSDRAMELNQAMFAGNGAYGYVLKPTCFFGMPLAKPAKYRLLIISAQHIQKPISVENFRAEVNLEVVTFKEEAVRFRTTPVKTNGYNCIWRQPVEIDVRYPELTFLRFQIHDIDNNTLGPSVYGAANLSLSSLSTGFRHVPLNGRNGEKLEFSTLFVKKTLL